MMLIFANLSSLRRLKQAFFVARNYLNSQLPVVLDSATAGMQLLRARCLFSFFGLLVALSRYAHASNDKSWPPGFSLEQSHSESSGHISLAGHAEAGHSQPLSSSASLETGFSRTPGHVILQISQHGALPAAVGERYVKEITRVSSCNNVTVFSTNRGKRDPRSERNFTKTYTPPSIASPDLGHPFGIMSVCTNALPT